MTPIVDIDNLTVQMLPSAQRLEYWEIFAKSLNSDIKRINTFFQYYQNGSIDSGYWSVSTTYGKGELIRDLTGVYESQTDGNIGNAISDTTYWLLVLPSFIGANERIRFDGKYLQLTWDLNRIFNTTFRQPPYPYPYDFGTGSGVFSDIYITNDIPVYTEFVMYPTDIPSSKMYPIGSGAWFMFTPPIYTAASTFRFVINIPVAVYTALGADAAIRESVVRKFVDPLVPSGINYRILTY